MKFRFRDQELRRLYLEADYTDGRPPGVVKAFRKVIGIVNVITNETQFRMFGGLKFERLKGNRRHQCSMRLNDQYRLIVELEGEAPDKVVVVVAIEDYH
jgi:proteic killer suppression protein